MDRAEVTELLARLSPVDEKMRREYPGAPSSRQPVHTCYVPAGAIGPDTVHDWGRQALAALDGHLPGPTELAALLDLDPGTASAVHPRVRAKLERAPVEDLRFDFEDGYGTPDDETEDADADRTARIAARWCAGGGGPQFFGPRVKSFDTPQLRERSARTLDVFLTALLDEGGDLPDGLVITFPKVVDVAQVEVFAELLGLLEERLGLPSGALRFEIQVETTQSVVDADGRFALPGFLRAGAGRISGLHFGTYDYTAACGLTAQHQHLAHGACDFARNAMQVAAAGRGVLCSDGSTNVLPVGDQVEHGWRTHYRLVRRSLAHGFHQSWDLHPAQLVTRYAAVFAEFREAAGPQGERLAAYVGQSDSAVLDEPATARALAATFVRALDSGATDAAEVQRTTGIDEDRLRSLAR
ncbi:aldolase [Saccharopolyspora sp. HNM0983]|uniref:Aldolase n=1 Tax=Saccharopolyspora montiporae TaxID=2781240 RepID=A0A929G0Q6_9PSEU|nr:aldolase [Saccharopolyspora sp. HNM0983]